MCSSNGSSYFYLISFDSMVGTVNKQALKHFTEHQNCRPNEFSGFHQFSIFEVIESLLKSFKNHDVLYPYFCVNPAPVNPSTPKSDQCQISPATSPEI